MTWCRILRRNPDKSRKSCARYSQSPQLCLETYIFQNHATSHGFCSSVTVPQLCLEISIFQTHATSHGFYSSVTVHYKGERRKTLKKIMPPFLWFKKSVQKSQIWQLSRLCPETSTNLYVHELDFWCSILYNVHVYHPLKDIFTRCIQLKHTSHLQHSISRTHGQKPCIPAEFINR